MTAFDLVLSLERQFSSTIFAIHHFAGAFLSALALITMLALAAARRDLLPARAVAQDVLHDLGKLLFAFAFFWGYIWFCQFMLIWYTNMPEETGYYALYEWWKGAPPQANDTIGLLMPNFTLFYAVTMYAGPDLTHETWRDALFANPGTTQAITQPYLTYGDKGIWPYTDYSGVDDATAIWWDPAATGPDEIRKEGTGMYAYVDGGTRYLPGEWPTEDRMFDPEGAVTIYVTPPAGEEPPDIPSPAGG